MRREGARISSRYCAATSYLRRRQASRLLHAVRNAPHSSHMVFCGPSQQFCSCCCRIFRCLSSDWPASRAGGIDRAAVLDAFDRGVGDPGFGDASSWRIDRQRRRFDLFSSEGLKSAEPTVDEVVGMAVGSASVVHHPSAFGRRRQCLIAERWPALAKHKAAMALFHHPGWVV